MKEKIIEQLKKFRILSIPEFISLNISKNSKFLNRKLNELIKEKIIFSINKSYGKGRPVKYYTVNRSDLDLVKNSHLLNINKFLINIQSDKYKIITIPEHSKLTHNNYSAHDICSLPFDKIKADGVCFLKGKKDGEILIFLETDQNLEGLVELQKKLVKYNVCFDHISTVTKKYSDIFNHKISQFIVVFMVLNEKRQKSILNLCEKNNAHYILAGIHNTNIFGKVFKNTSDEYISLLGDIDE